MGAFRNDGYTGISKNAADKINLYVKNGIYPGVRLITTYETQEQPLDTTIVQKLIAYHFKEDGK